MTVKGRAPREEGQQSKYSLEDHSGDPISADDSEVPAKPQLFFDAVSNSNAARRHQSMRLERNDAFTEEI